MSWYLVTLDKPHLTRKAHPIGEGAIRN
jgi:hypothetical protein